ncbi:MAG: ATP-binding cassette domain-containing protein [Limnochordaceae bacterium]|nr:ATP-binding cassette domain-containing protein [Limnochordaceae bacterium]
MTSDVACEPVLRFDQLVCEPARGLRRIVASGEVPEGGALVLRGPSGAGKSTLLRALARLVPIVSGRVWLAGRDMGEFSPPLWRRLVHYLAQRPVVFDGSALDNVLVPYRLRIFKDLPPPGRDRVVEAMTRLGLSDPAQDARTLSGGELARVALLRAVFAGPSVLLLDEPTAALDADTRRTVIQFLGRWVKARPGRGLVLVSHVEEDGGAFSPVTAVDLHRNGTEAAP